jgi:hypothetical protein
MRNSVKFAMAAAYLQPSSVLLCLLVPAMGTAIVTMRLVKTRAAASAEYPARSLAPAYRSSL